VNEKLIVKFDDLTLPPAKKKEYQQVKRNGSVCEKNETEKSRLVERNSIVRFEK
jgi:hypothetical protein